MSAVSVLTEHLYKVDALNAAVAMMDWDQNTFMPAGGARARAEHVGILGRMAHEGFVADETASLLERATSSATSENELAVVRVVRRSFDQQTKIPGELVERKLKLSAQAHDIWVKARENDDFASFQPALEQLVEIAREEAACYGFVAHPYDALTDLYEEGATAKKWQEMFDTIREPLVLLVAEIKAAPQIDDSFLTGTWDLPAQRSFTEGVVKAIGFDFNRGRQDEAPHPFCTNWSVGDVRLTTRFNEVLTSGLFSSLHEAGHGMYEQGSPWEWDRSPIAGGVSLGVHESQSRTWENIVGRSRAFWEHFYGPIRKAFPSLPDVGVDAFFRAVNRAEPSLIRVEADEVTYNLHIMIRFELECALLDGSLAVRDLPDAWNQKYAAYLGIEPSNDRDGCLQDVHWSGALFGYFPTYSMGNVLSYQIWNSLTSELGDVDELMRRGEFRPIFEWLHEKIYSVGRLHTPQDLTQRVTGRGLDASDYLKGITSKYHAVYGIAQGS